MDKSEIKLNAIAAMCDSNRGIGYKGRLPWSIPNDYKYFLQVSSKTQNNNKRNAVIVGRLTLESFFHENDDISVKMPDYVYVIVSGTLTKETINLHNQIDPNKVHICKTFDSAVAYTYDNLSNEIENIYVIGGSEIYRSAFQHKNLDHLYLTHVYKHFECDVFLQPENFLESFDKIENFHDFSVEGYEIDKLLVDPDSQVSYRFVVYRRKNQANK